MSLLLAEFQSEPLAKDKRRAARRKLRLELPTRLGGDGTRVLIHDLSETGLMLQTVAELAVGEVFELELPEAGPSSARVVWARDMLYGCDFLSPVSRGTVSAALLRAPYEEPAETETADHGPAAPQRAPASPAMVMASLTLLALVAMLFIAALLGAPFSLG